MINGLAGDIGPIGKSPSMDETFHRAHRLAMAQGHGVVTLEHMLFALTEDADAIGVMAASGVGIDKFRTDVSAYLGRLGDTLPAAGNGGAQPGPDLLRIVQLAASAARQSPRKQIDGAIILAAIIGEGKSPAAGMLKAHGLTFEEVIRVLQRGQSALPPQPQHPALARPATPPPIHPSQPPTPPPQRPAARQTPVPQSSPPQAPPAAPAASVGAQPARPAPAAPPSTEEILATVRARVKQAEPPPLTTRAPQAAPRPQAPEPPALPPATSIAPPAVPAEARREEPAPPPAKPAPPVPQPTPATAATPAPQQAAPTPVAEDAAKATDPQAKPKPAGPPAKPSAFEALAAAPRSPAKATPPPVPTAKPAAPPPLPSQRPAAQPPQAIAPATPPARPPTPASQPQPPQQQRATASPQAAASPAPSPAPNQPPVVLRPAVPLDIIAAARGIPGELPVGETAVIEIRIPREQLDVLRPSVQGSNGRIESPTTRAVGVQLICESPGALAITPLSAETMWFDRPSMTAGEEGVWRFAMTPVLKGKHGVTLSVLGRTIGAYGLQTDASTINETFEVTVRRSFGARLLRLGGYVAAFALGAVIANLAGARIAATVSEWIRLVVK